MKIFTIRWIIPLFWAIQLTCSHAGQAIATAHPLATDVGVKVLQAGGNAYDAAVAVTAALAVVEPYSSGLGGGGFYLIYNAKKKNYRFIDAREKAPEKSSQDMYLDQAGKVIPQLSVDGALAAGIPGIPAALAYIEKNYGSMSLATLLRPAQELAELGFPVDRHYQNYVQIRKTALESFPESKNIFLPQGNIPDLDSLLIQADLAQTLALLREKGIGEFYTGEIAQELVRAVQAENGIWTMSDLESYRVVERDPILINLGLGILATAPPPSSGGVALAQIMGQLDSLKVLDIFDHRDPQMMHYLIESMRRAYRDRAWYLGDDDYVDVSLLRLTSPDYAAGLAAGIHPGKASRSEWFSTPGDTPIESPETTHFSIIDKEGNMVSATLTVNTLFGSGMVAGNTGILLNNEMDDFSISPGVPNSYGLIGSDKNAIEPGKRMLSSMSPSILRMPDRDIVIGTPGGSRIITMLASSILSALAGFEAEMIVNHRRLHHQFLPDKVYYEPGFDLELVGELAKMGHQLEATKRTWGNMQVVIVNKDGRVSAASDPRGMGGVWVSN